MSIQDKIIEDVQSGLTDVTKAMHELTLTIISHKAELDISIATIKLESLHLKEQVLNIQQERKQDSNKISDRVFEIIKIVLPWIGIGLVSYFTLNNR